ncbi:hypothetical protein YC2023_022990 [Brassica napus]
MNIVCVRALYPPSRLLHRAERCRVGGRNYEKPELKQSNFSKDEDDLILRLHALLGNSSAGHSRLPDLNISLIPAETVVSRPWCTKHYFEKRCGYTYMNGRTKYCLGNLLTLDDVETQEKAITCVLTLSILKATKNV